MAQAGSHATADAYQTNIAYLDQSATQIAGVGGDGGNRNAASGGNVGAFGSVGPGAIDTGDNSAGNGGDGYFSGAMVHAPVAVYSPGQHCGGRLQFDCRRPSDEHRDVRSIRDPDGGRRRRWRQRQCRIGRKTSVRRTHPSAVFAWRDPSTR